MGWLHPDHGHGGALAAHADLVRRTSWLHLAPGCIAPRLGLPTTWPHIPSIGGAVSVGHQSKLGPLYAATGQRPVAVLDDEFGGTDPYTAKQRTADGVPTLLVPVSPFTGLRRGDIDTVLAWLHRD